MVKQELTLIHIGQDCVAEGNQFEEPCHVLDSGKGESVHHKLCHDAAYHIMAELSAH